jgi:hypothetical protein
LAFDHWPNASLSGRFEVAPSSFIFVKTGDSFRLNRIQIETASRMPDSRNGMRQPQSPNDASPIQVRMARISKSAMNRPSVAVVWIHEV